VLNSCKCKVLRLLYVMNKLAIVYNNVLYMYILLKDIYTRCFFRNVRGTVVPLYYYCYTVDPPLV